MDALRRIRKITAGSFVLDTWQMVFHIACFFCVVCSGVLLATLSLILLTQGKILTKKLYILLDCIIALIFAAELPFLYIINRLVS